MERPVRGLVSARDINVGGAGNGVERAKNSESEREAKGMAKLGRFIRTLQSSGLLETHSFINAMANILEHPFRKLRGERRSFCL